jgi:hypothetical protein
MPWLNLSGQQIADLSSAIRKTFTLSRFDVMLRVRLDINREDIALGDDYTEIVFKVITTAESQGWTAELLAGAREQSPGSPALVGIAQDVGLSSSSTALERKVVKGSPQLDVAIFRKRMGEVETQVCRITLPTPDGTAHGTGFLVGPGVVITNYHVIEPVISKQTRPEDVTVLFDYKKLGGHVISTGVEYKLAGDWLIDSSPMSPIDDEEEPKSGVPGLDQLDYAVLQLDGTPGSLPVGKGDATSPPRGWIPAPAAAYDFRPDTPLLIMQHPEALPLKLALEMQGIIGLNENATRLKHRVNTETGSSGAPCFTSGWDLVALHHGGDPNFSAGHTAQYNQGIPFSAILALLDKRQKTALVFGPWN